MQKTGKVDKKTEGGGGGSMTKSMRTENQDLSRSQGSSQGKPNFAFEPRLAVASPASWSSAPPLLLLAFKTLL